MVGFVGSCVLLAALAPAQPDMAAPATVPPALDHRISARLDPESHEISGTLELRWRNHSDEAVSELWFHSYMNAFRAMDTPWMRQARGHHRGIPARRDALGFMEISEVETSMGPSGELEYSPDATSFRVELAHALPPDATIDIRMVFRTRLPRVFARAGYAGSFHAAAHWYPKIARLERDGTWRAHAFGLHSEFYADFGRYQIELDLPASFQLLGTGQADPPLSAGAQLEPGYLRHRLEAQNVHDFTWFADPEMQTSLHAVAGAASTIDLRIGLPESQGHRAAPLAGSYGDMLTAFERRFVPYPWPTLAIVHPPAHAAGAAGMEYATAFTTYLDGPPPAFPWLYWRMPPGMTTTAHEMAHLYFQGLVASDEHTFPWLDEGLASLAALLVHTDLYDGPRASARTVLGHQLSLVDYYRQSLRRGYPVLAIESPASAFDDQPVSFAQTIYDRPVLAMGSVRNLIGATAWDRAMRSYVQRYGFRHPSGEDFREHMVEQLGRVHTLHARRDDPSSESIQIDLARLLDDLCSIAFDVNYTILKIRRIATVDGQGWRRGASGELEWHESEAAAWTSSEILLRADGNFQFPVRFSVVDTQGLETRHIWDGTGQFHRREFTGREIVAVTVDPQRELWIERNRSDNTRTTIDHEALDSAPSWSEDRMQPLLSSWVEVALTAAWGLSWP